MDRVVYKKSDDSRYKVSVRFAGAQIPVTRDISTNIESIKEAIDYAADVKADYVVTPEAALSGYYREFCETPEDQHNLIMAESEVINYAKSKEIGLCLGTLWMENEMGGQIKRNQMRYFNKFGSLLGSYNKIQTIKSDNVIPGVFSEPVIGNEELFIPGNNGHPSVELSNSTGLFDVSTLICNDMYGENQYGTAIARRALFSLKNRKNPVELVIHPTFGFRGDELCEPLLNPINADGTDPTANSITKSFEDWHRSHLEMLSYSTNHSFLVVDTCSSMNSEMSKHNTSSPSGVVVNGEWVTDVPRKGKQFFYHDFKLPGKILSTMEIDAKRPGLDILQQITDNNPKPVEES